MSIAETSRGYHSELRAEQARRTRERILRAAAAEFGARGYQATTVAAIGRAAGVSTETVKAAGSKAELLIGSFEVLFALEEGADSLGDSEAGRGVLDLPADQVIDAAIQALAEANARGRRLWTQLLAAALSDDLVADALERMLSSRRRDYLRLVELLIAQGVARAGLDPETAAAELSFLMSPESYQQLVDQSGWSDEHYRTWLRTCVRRAVQ